MLNTNTSREAFRQHAAIPVCVSGNRRRAAYALEEFWLGDPRLDGGQLSRILQSRGICGALVVRLMNSARLSEWFRPPAERLPAERWQDDLGNGLPLLEQGGGRLRRAYLLTSPPCDPESARLPK